MQKRIALRRGRSSFVPLRLRYDDERVQLYCYSPSYSLITASPFLSREPTCNHRRIEYTYQRHYLREVTA